MPYRSSHCHSGSCEWKWQDALLAAGALARKTNRWTMSDHGSLFLSLHSMDHVGILLSLVLDNLFHSSVVGMPLNRQ